MIYTFFGRSIIFAIMIACCTGSTIAQDRNEMTSQLSQSQTFFMENKGQWDEDVLFRSGSNGMDIWILKGSVINGVTELDKTEDKVNGHNIEFKFKNYNTDFTIEKTGQSSFYFNFLYGENQASEVYTYNRVTLKNIYDNIDLVYYNEEEHVRYDFVVNPGGDPNDIQIEINGSSDIKIKDNGNLEIVTSINPIEHQDLFVYQGEDREEIEAGFELKDNLLAFNIGDYNENESLVIDPKVLATCYSWKTVPGTLGPSFHVDAKAFNIDSDGNFYLAGIDRDFSGAKKMEYGTGVYQRPGPSHTNFLSKFDNDGVLLWCSYVKGGGNANFIRDIELDLQDNPIVAGIGTGGIETTNDAFQSTYQGGTANGFKGDGFILKLKKDGTTLLYGTYMGGASGNDNIHDIVVDGLGNIYFVGNTNSTNLPTQNAYQNTLGGDHDCMLGMMKPLNNGYVLEFLSYFGGGGIHSPEEMGEAIDIDENGFIYITGYGSEFPKSTSPYKATGRGLVAKFYYDDINDNLSLEYSSNLAANGSILGVKIKAKNGIAHIVGSGSIEITQDSYDNTGGGMFYMKLATDDYSGTDDLLYSTYFDAGAGQDKTDVWVSDYCDNVIISSSLFNTLYDDANLPKDTDFSTLATYTNNGNFSQNSFVTILDPWEYKSAAIKYLAYTPGIIADIKPDYANGLINFGGTLIQLNNITDHYVTDDPQGSITVDQSSHITVLSTDLCPASQDNCCDYLDFDSWYVEGANQDPTPCLQGFNCQAMIRGNIKPGLCAGTLKIFIYDDQLGWVENVAIGSGVLGTGDFSRFYCLEDGSEKRFKLEYYSSADPNNPLCSKIIPYSCPAPSCCSSINELSIGLSEEACCFDLEIDIDDNDCINEALIYIDKNDGNGFVHDQSLTQFTYNPGLTKISYCLPSELDEWDFKVVFKDMLKNVVCTQEVSYACNSECCEGLELVRFPIQPDIGSCDPGACDVFKVFLQDNGWTPCDEIYQVKAEVIRPSGTQSASVVWGTPPNFSGGYVFPLTMLDAVCVYPGEKVKVRITFMDVNGDPINNGNCVLEMEECCVDCSMFDYEVIKTIDTQTNECSFELKVTPNSPNECDVDVKIFRQEGINDLINGPIWQPVPSTPLVTADKGTLPLAFTDPSVMNYFNLYYGNGNYPIVKYIFEVNGVICYEEEVSCYYYDDPFFKESYGQHSQEAIQLGLNVIPNPVTDQARFEFNTVQQTHVVVEIYDLQGQKVSTVYHGLSSEGPNSYRFSTSSLSTGTYLIKLNLDGSIYSYQFIKE